MPRQRETRNRNKIQQITGECDPPIGTCFICPITEDKPQGVIDKFPRTGDDAHHRSAGTQESKVGPHITVCALIGNVGEETNKSDQPDKTKSLFAGEGHFYPQKELAEFTDDF